MHERYGWYRGEFDAGCSYILLFGGNTYIVRGWYDDCCQDNCHEWRTDALPGKVFKTADEGCQAVEDMLHITPIK